VSSVTIQSNADNTETFPKEIKIYINLSNPSFTNIEDEKTVESIKLTIDSGSRVALKSLKFHRVNSLTFFIDGNYGDTVTTLSELSIYGYTLDGLDVANIRKKK
jgi:pectate lyase